MLDELKKLESNGKIINIGLIGAGYMGVGIALQISKTPGMRLSFIADLDTNAIEKAKRAYGDDSVLTSTNPDKILEDISIPLDVLVESTNSIGAAARYCIKAIRRKSHVVIDEC